MSHNSSLKIMKSLLLNLSNGRFSNNTKNVPQSSKKVDFHFTRFSLTKLFNIISITLARWVETLWDYLSEPLLILGLFEKHSLWNHLGASVLIDNFVNEITKNMRGHCGLGDLNMINKQNKTNKLNKQSSSIDRFLQMKTKIHGHS
jgi:hypothetical protein